MRFPALTKKKIDGEDCPLNFFQKFGVLAFLFFTIKGLLWLIVPAIIAISI